MNLIPIDQNSVREALATGLSPYTIAMRLGYPPARVKSIKDGFDTPYYKKYTRTRGIGKSIINKKKLCRCCGHRAVSKKNMLLCDYCFRNNSGEPEYY